MHPGNPSFEIQNPHEYTCKVWRYFVNHSRLLVRVYKGKIDEEEFYLNFEMVQFFEGPLGWKGANFYIEKAAECIKILRRQQGFERVSDEDLAEIFDLYVVDLPGSRSVKIVAAKNVNRSIAIPPDFLI